MTELNPMLKRLAEEYGAKDVPMLLLGRTVGCRFAIAELEAELRLAEAEAKVAQIKRDLVLASQELDEADDALAQIPPDLLEDILAAVERRLEAA
ncbi:hypothetical protein H9N28_13330 [Rhodobacter capsulatus]|uniref:hypothetical protein n=1 Tax=Rhodobacter capsulatus TaxID=1061 RepID=UPI000AE790FD|nr:hypothetical protein [Rhodobacter capsulatus]PZX21094.1 hypothetical protein LY44_03533 [Rhodobacter capsulatus]QNR62533.1 hypothetical protein H9N28_13330 [Rhodobacter capsulatus]